MKDLQDKIAKRMKECLANGVGELDVLEFNALRHALETVYYINAEEK